MADYNEQCKKCFHFQVCAQVMKNQLFIREKMLKEENPKCEHFVNAADVVEVRHGYWIPISDGEGAECSECGEYYDTRQTGGMTAFRQFQKFYAYCSCCGAKMDGDSGV